MKNISLEHSIRNVLTGQNVNSDNKELTELSAGTIETGINAAKNASKYLPKSLIKPLEKPNAPKIPDISPPTPVGPKIEPVVPGKVSPTSPTPVSPNSPKPTTTPSSTPTLNTLPDVNPQSKTAINTQTQTQTQTQTDKDQAVDQKVDDKEEDKKNRRRRDFSFSGEPPKSDSKYLKSRVPVKTSVGLAKKRTVFEDVAVKNKKLVAVVKKAVDDKSDAKTKKSSNPMVDMHPTLKEPNEFENEQL